MEYRQSFIIQMGKMNNNRNVWKIYVLKHPWLHIDQCFWYSVFRETVIIVP